MNNIERQYNSKFEEIRHINENGIGMFYLNLYHIQNIEYSLIMAFIKPLFFPPLQSPPR